MYAYVVQEAYFHQIFRKKKLLYPFPFPPIALQLNYKQASNLEMRR
jgi:hypothetical protein